MIDGVRWVEIFNEKHCDFVEVFSMDRLLVAKVKENIATLYFFEDAIWHD